MLDGRTCTGLIGIGLVVILCLLPVAAAHSANRPFWTEKSSFIEGDELFVVGVASRARTIEEGRRQAFEQGKLELMNFAQITSLEAQGLVIETQMTFEELNADGTVTVYRLLRAPAAKLVMIQGRLQAQSRAQEQAIDQLRNELATFQQSLTDKAAKLDQQQRQVEQMLQQVSTKIQSISTPANRSEGSGSLVDRLKIVEAKLDASEQELSHLFRQIQERVRIRSQRSCQYVIPGMTPSEVQQLVGNPDGKNFMGDSWSYGTANIHFNNVGVVYKVLCPR
ncbi:MAG: hypothetical protein KF751_09990 [Nitrospira sp.]|nr:hypothetical protein [Nitrospira sp.]